MTMRSLNGLCLIYVAYITLLLLSTFDMIEQFKTLSNCLSAWTTTTTLLRRTLLSLKSESLKAWLSETMILRLWREHVLLRSLTRRLSETTMMTVPQMKILRWRLTKSWLVD